MNIFLNVIEKLGLVLLPAYTLFILHSQLLLCMLVHTDQQL